MIRKDNRRILFITQWQYEDALIQTYTLPYVQIIKKITGAPCYLVCVNNKLTKAQIAVKDSISIIDVPNGKGGQFIRWPKNILLLNKIIRKEKITHLHPWCTPAGAIGVILKTFNKQLTLNIDSFEPHAEAMVENGTWSALGLKYKALSYFEKIEAKRANNLIFAAPGMQNYIKEKYGLLVSEYAVKPACVDLNEFSDKAIKDEALMKQFCFNGKIVCVYAGKFGGIYLEDETFEFIKKCQDYWGIEKFRFLLLSNVVDSYVKEMCVKHGIEEHIISKLFVPHNDIPKYVGLADFAICPVKAVPTKQYCSPIKDGEYWALGLPVVITPNISIDSAIIAENNAGAIIDTLNDEGYLKAIREIDAILLSSSREAIYAKIRPLAEKYRNFTIAEKVYEAIYASV